MRSGRRSPLLHLCSLLPSLAVQHVCLTELPPSTSAHGRAEPPRSPAQVPHSHPPRVPSEHSSHWPQWATCFWNFLHPLLTGVLEPPSLT